MHLLLGLTELAQLAVMAVMELLHLSLAVPLLTLAAAVGLVFLAALRVLVEPVVVAPLLFRGFQVQPIQAVAAVVEFWVEAPAAPAALAS